MSKWYTKEPGPSGPAIKEHESKLKAGIWLLFVGGPGLDLDQFGLYRTNPKKDANAVNMLYEEAAKAARRRNKK